jgi:hypothetical protein
MVRGKPLTVTSAQASSTAVSASDLRHAMGADADDDDADGEGECG